MVQPGKSRLAARGDGKEVGKGAAKLIPLPTRSDRKLQTVSHCSTSTDKWKSRYCAPKLLQLDNTVDESRKEMENRLARFSSSISEDGN